MTYDDDLIRFTNPQGEEVNYALVSIGLSWPPPRLLNIKLSDDETCEYVLANRSTITDEERAEMTHVARVAEYTMMSEYLGEPYIRDFVLVDVRGVNRVPTLASIMGGSY